jgi:intracellular septation protein
MTDETKDKPKNGAKIDPLLKLALDIGPLVLFFTTVTMSGIYAATAVFMVAVVAALLVSHAMTREWPIMPVVTAFVVMVFGGLTLWLHNDTFIKIKPTVIYSLFSVVLFGGYIFDRPFLKTVLDAAFHLTEEGWRKLTLRWALFFPVLAVLNEVVWRTQSDSFWAGFKIACVVITAAFAAAQTPLIMRCLIEEPEPAESSLGDVKQDGQKAA